MITYKQMITTRCNTATFETGIFIYHYTNYCPSEHFISLGVLFHVRGI